MIAKLYFPSLLGFLIQFNCDYTWQNFKGFWSYNNVFNFSRIFLSTEKHRHSIHKNDLHFMTAEESNILTIIVAEQELVTNHHSLTCL